MVQLAAVSFSWTKMVMMVMAMMAAAEVRAACVGAKWVGIRHRLGGDVAEPIMSTAGR